MEYDHRIPFSLCGSKGPESESWDRHVREALAIVAPEPPEPDVDWIEQDARALAALRGATFAPGAKLILPSGQELQF
jgi:hypothetical protein